MFDDKHRPYINLLTSKYGEEPWLSKEKLSHPWMSYARVGNYKKHNLAFWILVREEALVTYMLMAV